jgi:hypothetical protein
LPDGRIPTAPIPDLVPNFVVELLSVSNTYGESISMLESSCCGSLIRGNGT